MMRGDTNKTRCAHHAYLASKRIALLPTNDDVDEDAMLMLVMAISKCADFLARARRSNLIIVVFAQCVWRTRIYTTLYMLYQTRWCDRYTDGYIYNCGALVSGCMKWMEYCLIKGVCLCVYLCWCNDSPRRVEQEILIRTKVVYYKSTKLSNIAKQQTNNVQWVHFERIT